MATEFRLPELGEDIDSGDVINVLVSVGDAVAEEQPVMEIETDKATIEVPAPVGGTIKEIHVKEGAKVKVGQLLFTIDDGSEGKEQADAKLEVEEVKEEDGGRSKNKQTEAEAEGKEEEGGEEEIKAEEAEERVEEKREGAEAETEEEAEEGEEREEERVGTKQEERKEEERVRAKEEREKEEEKKETKAEATKEKKEERGERKEKKREDREEKKKETKSEVKEEKQEEREAGEKAEERQGEVVEFGRKGKTAAKDQPPQEQAPAAPSVRRLARELGVDISQIAGSGPGGRISEEDVKNYTRWIVTRGISAGTDIQPAALPTTPAPLPDFTQWGEVERKPMTNVRRKTAEVMSSAWTTIPHVTQHDKADISNLEKLRKEFGKKAEEAGGKLTLTAVLLKVVASALRVFPQLNASVDMAGEEIIYKKYYNIGVAVDTERGLYVPVIRDVDKKNIVELSAELIKAAEKARNRKLSPEEMKGGTFTISNQGTIGGIYFSPIINWPEVAILGVSRSRTEPIYLNGQFEPRLMMPLSLSHDHRAVDGADAVRFLRWVIEALEEPFKLILEG